MTELDKKINNLKDFIKGKTDQGTANYLGKEIREICGMVETEQCNIDLVSKRNWFDKMPLHWKLILHTGVGVLLGLTIAYVC